MTTLFIETVITTIITLFLISLNFYLARLSRTLYAQKYRQHLVFEYPESGTPLATSPWSIQQVIVGVMLSAFMAACGLFIMYFINPILDTTRIITFIQSYLIALLTVALARYIGSILVFQYTVKHPEDLSGVTHFKYPIVRMLHLSMNIRYISPLLVLCIFYPTDFMIGAAMGAMTLMLCELGRVIRLPIY